MKVLNKIIALSFAAIPLFAFAACGENEADGKACGLVHGAGYVAMATVTLKGEKIAEATLTEVCFPTYVEAGELVPAADKVADTVNEHGEEVEKTFYKNVSYGDVNLTYVAGSGYMKGTVLFTDLMKDEDEAEDYFKAVMNSELSVTVDGRKKTDVLNKSSLCKDDNGYWTRTDKNGNNYSRWKMNRDATVDYVKLNGTAGLTKLVKSETPSPDLKEDKEVYYWTDGNLSTGATWTDLNNGSANGYYTYARLFVKAYSDAVD